jgi:DHA2 family multidrug resistance protein
VTAPRGLGTLAAMLILGRLMNRTDLRLLIAAGFAMTAASLWMMTHFYLQMPSAGVVWSGVLQGVGTGFVLVPVSAITFTTLAPHLRNEGTAVFSLMRNIGSSIGISGVVALLTRNTQIMHARLAEHVTPFGDGFAAAAAAAPDAARWLAGVNAQVSRQAAMLAYNNDFQLMLVLSLCAVPLVLMLRPVKHAGSSRPAPVAE